MDNSPKIYRWPVSSCPDRYSMQRRCSPSLIIREMQIRTTVRYHFTAMKVAIKNKNKDDSVGEDVKKSESSYCIPGGNVKWYSCYEENNLPLY